MTDEYPGLHYPINLSRLPRGWITGPIGDFVSDIRPGFPSGQHNKMGEGIAHLRPMNIDRKGTVDMTVVKYVADGDGQRVAPGDVIFNNTNSPELVGKTAVVPEGLVAAYSNHMTRLGAPEGVDSRFLAIQLHYLWMSGYFLHLCVNHVNQASVASRTLSTSVPLVVPPLAEQRRIVAEIETQLTRLDAAEGALGRALANLRRYRAAVLAAAVQGNLAAPGGSTTPTSAWTYEEARILCDGVNSGNTPPPDEMHTSGLVPFIKVYNLTFTGKLDFSIRPTFISEKTHFRLRKSIARPGDVLMNIVGPPLGKVSLVPDDYPEWNTNQAVVVFRPGPRLRNEYLCYALMAEPVLRPLVQKARATAGQFNISVNMCRSMVIPVPPLPEQDRLVAEAERRLSVVEASEAAIAANLKRAEKLRQAVLRKAFAGELVAQDPADEPAAALLERIRAERAAVPSARRRGGRTARQQPLPLGATTDTRAT